MFLTPQKDCRRQRTSAVPNLLKLNPVAFISRLKAVNSAIGVGGGVSLIKHVSQRDGRRDEWQSLHPVIHTESFEVKPEGRRADRLEQRRWFQASQKGLQRRKVWAAAKHTQVGDENTHTHTHMQSCRLSTHDKWSCYSKFPQSEINNTANRVGYTFSSLLF